MVPNYEHFRIYKSCPDDIFWFRGSPVVRQSVCDFQVDF